METENITFYVIRRKKDGWYSLMYGSGYTHDPLDADRYDDWECAYAAHDFETEEVVEVSLNISLQVKEFK